MKDIKEKLTQLICSRLNQESALLSDKFAASIDQVGVRYAVVDDLLPLDVAKHIHDVFPATNDMRLMDSFREKKYTSKSFEKFNPLMEAITFAIQDPRVVSIVEKITGVKEQIPDPNLYAGGLSAMGKDCFLGPHIDNSHEMERKFYRTFNLLYYITPDWSLEFGGNLELWDRNVKRHTTIVSQFNRLVIMETNPWSWHSVSKVKVDNLRCCVSNYYFSPRSPTGQDYFNVTSFSARPEQKLLRAMAWSDNKLRQAVRFVFPQGLGKKDVYQARPK